MEAGDNVSGIIDNHTLTEWARIVQEVWELRIIKYRIQNTSTLFRSLYHHVTREANGDVAKVDFFFKLYGVYVDMGVGKGYKLGNSGDLLHDRGFIPQREARRWYSSAWYGQVKKLTEIIAEKTGRRAARLIAGVIYGAMDDKINNYRMASNARSARNYRRRIASPDYYLRAPGEPRKMLGNINLMKNKNG